MIFNRGSSSSLDCETIVNTERTQLASDWSNPKRRLELAPGSDLVEAVFAHFGATYRKPTDTERLARVMRREEIPAEIETLITRAASLTGRDI